MSKISFGRAMNSLPSYSGNQLLEMRNKIDLLLAEKTDQTIQLQDGDYQRGFAAGHSAGMAHAVNCMNIYYKARDELKELRARATYMAGVINAGAGETAKKIMRVANADFGAQMSEVINQYKETQRLLRGKMKVFDPDLSFAQEIFKTALDYIEAPTADNNGDNLRALFAERNPIFLDHVDIHDEHKPGQRADDLSLEFTQKVIKLVDSGMTYEDTGNTLALFDEFQPLIAETKDLTDMVRKRYKRNKPKTILSHNTGHNVMSARIE